MATRAWRVVGLSLLWLPAAVLLCLHLGLVLFEDGDFGPPARSDGEVVLLCAAAALLIGAGLPWFVRSSPRSDRSWRRPATLSRRERQFVVALQSASTMLFFMVLIEPAGGRRVLLSIAVPLPGLPLATAAAWWSSGASRGRRTATVGADDRPAP